MNQERESEKQDELRHKIADAYQDLADDIIPNVIQEEVSSVKSEGGEETSDISINLPVEPPQCNPSHWSIKLLQFQPKKKIVLNEEGSLIESSKYILCQQLLLVGKNNGEQIIEEQKNLPQVTVPSIYDEQFSTLSVNIKKVIEAENKQRELNKQPWYHNYGKLSSVEQISMVNQKGNDGIYGICNLCGSVQRLHAFRSNKKNPDRTGPQTSKVPLHYHVAYLQQFHNKTKLPPTIRPNPSILPSSITQPLTFSLTKFYCYLCEYEKTVGITCPRHMANVLHLNSDKEIQDLTEVTLKSECYILTHSYNYYFRLLWSPSVNTHVDVQVRRTLEIICCGYAFIIKLLRKAMGISTHGQPTVTEEQMTLAQSTFTLLKPMLNFSGIRQYCRFIIRIFDPSHVLLEPTMSDVRLHDASKIVHKHVVYQSMNKRELKACSKGEPMSVQQIKDQEIMASKFVKLNKMMSIGVVAENESEFNQLGPNEQLVTSTLDNQVLSQIIQPKIQEKNIFRFDDWYPKFNAKSSTDQLILQETSRESQIQPTQTITCHKYGNNQKSDLPTEEAQIQEDAIMDYIEQAQSEQIEKIRKTTVTVAFQSLSEEYSPQSHQVNAVMHVLKMDTEEEYVRDDMTEFIKFFIEMVQNCFTISKELHSNVCAGEVREVIPKICEERGIGKGMDKLALLRFLDRDQQVLYVTTEAKFQGMKRDNWSLKNPSSTGIIVHLNPYNTQHQVFAKDQHDKWLLDTLNLRVRVLLNLIMEQYSTQGYHLEDKFWLTNQNVTNQLNLTLLVQTFSRLISQLKWPFIGNIDKIQQMIQQTTRVRTIGHRFTLDLKYMTFGPKAISNFMRTQEDSVMDLYKQYKKRITQECTNGFTQFNASLMENVPYGHDKLSTYTKNQLDETYQRFLKQKKITCFYSVLAQKREIKAIRAILIQIAERIKFFFLQSQKSMKYTNSSKQGQMLELQVVKEWLTYDSLEFRGFKDLDELIVALVLQVEQMTFNQTLTGAMLYWKGLGQRNSYALLCSAKEQINQATKFVDKDSTMNFEKEFSSYCREVVKDWKTRLGTTLQKAIYSRLSIQQAQDAPEQNKEGSYQSDSEQFTREILKQSQTAALPQIQQEEDRAIKERQRLGVPFEEELEEESMHDEDSVVDDSNQNLNIHDDIDQFEEFVQFASTLANNAQQYWLEGSLSQGYDPSQFSQPPNVLTDVEHSTQYLQPANEHSLTAQRSSQMSQTLQCDYEKFENFKQFMQRQLTNKYTHEESWLCGLHQMYPQQHPQSQSNQACSNMNTEIQAQMPPFNSQEDKRLIQSNILDPFKTGIIEETPSKQAQIADPFKTGTNLNQVGRLEEQIKDQQDLQNDIQVQASPEQTTNQAVEQHQEGISGNNEETNYIIHNPQEIASIHIQNQESFVDQQQRIDFSGGIFTSLLPTGDLPPTNQLFESPMDGNNKLSTNPIIEEDRNQGNNEEFTTLSPKEQINQCREETIAEEIKTETEVKQKMSLDESVQDSAPDQNASIYLKKDQIVQSEQQAVQKAKIIDFLPPCAYHLELENIEQNHEFSQVVLQSNRKHSNNSNNPCSNLQAVDMLSFKTKVIHNDPINDPRLYNFEKKERLLQKVRQQSGSQYRGLQKTQTEVKNQGNMSPLASGNQQSSLTQTGYHRDQPYSPMVNHQNLHSQVGSGGQSPPVSPQAKQNLFQVGKDTLASQKQSQMSVTIDLENDLQEKVSPVKSTSLIQWGVNVNVLDSYRLQQPGSTLPLMKNFSTQEDPLVYIDLKNLDVSEVPSLFTSYQEKTGLFFPHVPDVITQEKNAYASTNQMSILLSMIRLYSQQGEKEYTGSQTVIMNVFFMQALGSLSSFEKYTSADKREVLMKFAGLQDINKYQDELVLIFPVLLFDEHLSLKEASNNHWCVVTAKLHPKRSYTPEDDQYNVTEYNTYATHNLQFEDRESQLWQNLVKFLNILTPRGFSDRVDKINCGEQKSVECGLNVIKIVLALLERVPDDQFSEISDADHPITTQNLASMLETFLRYRRAIDSNHTVPDPILDCKQITKNISDLLFISRQDLAQQIHDSIQVKNQEALHDRSLWDRYGSLYHQYQQPNKVAEKHGIVRPEKTPVEETKSDLQSKKTQKTEKKQKNIVKKIVPDPPQQTLLKFRVRQDQDGMRCPTKARPKKPISPEKQLWKKTKEEQGRIDQKQQQSKRK